MGLKLFETRWRGRRLPHRFELGLPFLHPGMLPSSVVHLSLPPLAVRSVAFWGIGAVRYRRKTRADRPRYFSAVKRDPARGGVQNVRIIQSPPVVPVGTRRDFFCERSGRLTLTAQKAMELDLACSSESCPALSSSPATDPPSLGWNPQTFLPHDSLQRRWGGTATNWYAPMS